MSSLRRDTWAVNFKKIFVYLKYFYPNFKFYWGIRIDLSGSKSFFSIECKTLFYSLLDSSVPVEISSVILIVIPFMWLFSYAHTPREALRILFVLIVL